MEDGVKEFSREALSEATTTLKDVCFGPFRPDVLSLIEALDHFLRKISAQICLMIRTSILQFCVL